MTFFLHSLKKKKKRKKKYRKTFFSFLFFLLLQDSLKCWLLILESWKIISECHGPDSWLLKTWPFPKYKNMHSLFLHTMSTIIQFLTQHDQTKFFICYLKKKDWLSEHQNSFPSVFILVVESGKYFIQILIYLKITAKYIILLVL